MPYNHITGAFGPDGGFGGEGGEGGFGPDGPSGPGGPSGPKGMFFQIFFFMSDRHKMFDLLIDCIRGVIRTILTNLVHGVV